MCERMGLAVWTIASAFLVFLALSHGLPWIVVIFGSGLVALVVGVDLCLPDHPAAKTGPLGKRASTKTFAALEIAF